jgi:phosphopantothenoylcysteine decarboxylase/phosphopantothenate--cysteine ligase
MMIRERSNRRGSGLAGKNILLIVTGGIAAYKSAFLVRLLERGGADVRVLMTDAAVRFVTPLTFEVLTGNPVPMDLFASRDKPVVEHVELAGWADRVVVAPATADFLGKVACGLADDLPSTAIMAARCPVYFAPAMNTGMWNNPAVIRNIEILEKDGRKFIDPGKGELACGDTGPGRMAEPEEIARALEASFAPGDLAGVRLLVTAGRTEESIDPVRYISNRSSGRMGFAIAAEAKGRGAHVTLVHGPVDVEPPSVDSVKSVTTAREMRSAVLRAFGRCDALIMAAAVADFTPVTRRKGKIKRRSGSQMLVLEPTADILAEASKRRKKQVVVGFALETDAPEANAKRKGKEKGCDYIVLNRIGKGTGFRTDTNRITVFKGGRRVLSTDLVTKEQAASHLVDIIARDKRL